jgi:AcrR family transcriptional regulator
MSNRFPMAHQNNMVSKTLKTASLPDGGPVPATRSARQRILDAAIPLFYREGARAVGIDTVIAKSGVAKMSLYRSFRSKDELIAACLEERDKSYWQWFEKVVAEHPGDPREQLRALIRGVAKRTSRPGYRGCFFLNTAMDYVDAWHPGRKLAVRHKQTLASRLLKICRQLEVRDPVALSRQLVLLVNGAQATAGMLGKKTQMELVNAAERLIDDTAARRVPRAQAK